jgi:tyrosyl-tRNA synthetase
MDKIEEVLTRGVQQVLPDKKGLADFMAKRKIKLYQGFDPSMPSLHLGNFVGLMKLRQFQKLGHEVIFLVGDFTGMIGDPTDKLSARPKLTREKVLENAKSWKEQAGKVLDFEGENSAKIMFNSEWSDKLTARDLIDISSHLTHQQMIERDMYQERIKKNEPIYFHELLYPIFQGYDSVKMDVDLEIGGNDQLFNMMVGRTLMKAIKNKEKYVLTTKLLVDSEGKKVGKTTGNALFLDSTPENFYAGVMSFPDGVIKLGFELLTEVSLEGLDEKIKKDPMGEKKRLAEEIVKFLWGIEKARKAQENFEQTFQERAPEFNIKIKAEENAAKTLIPFSPRQSMSSVKELIRQGAIDINGEKLMDGSIKLKIGDKIKVGDRTFLKVEK